MKENISQLLHPERQTSFCVGHNSGLNSINNINQNLQNQKNILVILLNKHMEIILITLLGYISQS